MRYWRGDNIVWCQWSVNIPLSSLLSLSMSYLWYSNVIRHDESILALSCGDKSEPQQLTPNMYKYLGHYWFHTVQNVFLKTKATQAGFSNRHNISDILWKLGWQQENTTPSFSLAQRLVMPAHAYLSSYWWALTTNTRFFFIRNTIIRNIDLHCPKP